MSKYWEEFYIIQRESGQALFHVSFSNKKYDADLFAGLFSAILQYAKAYSKQDIGSFEMKKKLILIAQSDDFPVLYVYIIDKKRVKKKKKITQMLNFVKEEFEEAYPKEKVVDWNGNITYFKRFKENVDKILHPWKRFEEFGF